MSQSRLASFVEAWTNIGVGWVVNFTGNLIILPLFGLPVTVGKAFGIGVCFTGISVIRLYAIRRWFNR